MDKEQKIPKSTAVRRNFTVYPETRRKLYELAETRAALSGRRVNMSETLAFVVNWAHKIMIGKEDSA